MDASEVLCTAHCRLYERDHTMPGVRLDELHHQCISSLNAGKEPVVGAQEAKKKGPELRQFSPAKVTLVYIYIHIY